MAPGLNNQRQNNKLALLSSLPGITEVPNKAVWYRIVGISSRST